jgi:hypothetical protein
MGSMKIAQQSFDRSDSVWPDPPGVGYRIVDEAADCPHYAITFRKLAGVGVDKQATKQGRCSDRLDDSYYVTFRACVDKATQGDDRFMYRVLVGGHQATINAIPDIENAMMVA